MAGWRCLSLVVLAVGAAHAKRSLNQIPEAVSQAGAAATESVSKATTAASETISKATQSFAGSAQAADMSIAAQIDAAKNAAKAAVPKELDQSASSVLSLAAESMVPADFKNKVEAAMKNFQANKGSSNSKTVDPQIHDFAKMLAGVLLLDNAGDSNIANQKLGDLIRMLIDFTFNLAKVYVTAPAKIITELPGDLSAALAHSQPQNFAAWFADHKQVYADLLGIVYKPNGAQGSLTHPDSVDISGNFISYAPCIVSSTPAGFAFGATGVSIAPQIFQSAPTGANIQPQGANIQPALIYFFPAGFNVQPQGLNVAPTLIGVTPGGYSNIAAGGVIGGSVIAVSAAQAPTGS